MNQHLVHEIEEEYYGNLRTLNRMEDTFSVINDNMKKIGKKIWVMVLSIVVLLGGIYFMNQQYQRAKIDGLYRHAFSLLEEQLATYIVENYSGVSKVEFSPIYVEASDLYNMGRITVVPVIYDNHGNKAILGGRVKNVLFAAYGYPGDISSLDFTIEGHHFIYLANSQSGEEIDVSDDERLVEEAKISSSMGIDENLEWLVEDKQLRDVEKEKSGSPKATIHYNLKIIRGEVADELI